MSWRGVGGVGWVGCVSLVGALKVVDAVKRGYVADGCALQKPMILKARVVGTTLE